MSNSEYKDVGDLKDLIQVLNSSVDFFNEAKKNVAEQKIQTIFDDVILSHKKSIAKLQPLVVAQTDEMEDGSHWSVKLRETYTNIISSFTSDKDLTYISQLEEVEDKLLKVCDDAMANNKFSISNSLLSEVRSEIKFSHDRIRDIEAVKERRAS